MNILNTCASPRGPYTLRLPGLRWLLKPSAFAAICLLGACAQTTPRTDVTFGNAVRIAVAQQTLNPDASKNTDPVSGIDARAARDAVDRYHKSFKEPTPHPSVFTIGIGSGG